MDFRAFGIRIVHPGIAVVHFLSRYVVSAATAPTVQPVNAADLEDAFKEQEEYTLVKKNFFYCNLMPYFLLKIVELLM